MFELNTIAQVATAKLAIPEADSSRSGRGLDSQAVDPEELQDQTNEEASPHLANRRQQKQQQKIDEKLAKATGSPKVRDMAHRSEDSEVVDLSVGDVEAQESSNNDTTTAIVDLTKKKQQYMEQDIRDKSGAYNYDADPVTYKKARKRLQNRESAVRSRTKKKDELERLEQQISELAEQKAAIATHNEILKSQNKHYEELYAKQLLAVPSQAQPEPIEYVLGNQATQGSQSAFVKDDSVPGQEALSQPTRPLSNIDEARPEDLSYSCLEMTRADFMKHQQCNEGFFSNAAHKTPQAQKTSLLPLARNISFEGQFPALSEGKPVMQEEQRDLLGDEVDVLNDEIGNTLNDHKRPRGYTGGLPQDFLF